jgi:8-oxo-dGTP diphosphatase
VSGIAYLIRHAKAGNRDAWEGSDAARPLSKSGRIQALGIRDLLAAEPVARVLSSPAVRCVETVQPLADSRGLAVEETEDLFEGRGPGPAHQLIRSVAGGPIALCTHGDVIELLLDDLAEHGVELPDGRLLKKGSIWVLAVDGGRIASGRYVPPPGMG